MEGLEQDSSGTGGEKDKGVDESSRAGSSMTNI